MSDDKINPWYAVPPAPAPPPGPDAPAPRYVGFWARTFASIVDSIVVLFVLVPAGLLLQFVGIGIGEDDPGAALIVHALLAVVILAFWLTRLATPGKMILDAVIVDATTLGKPSTSRFVIRYAAYFLSAFPLGLGFLWVAFDSRKQGWHDKLARTVVIRRPSS